jgi:hypothetical protein
MKISGAGLPSQGYTEKLPIAGHQVRKTAKEGVIVLEPNPNLMQPYTTIFYYDLSGQSVNYSQLKQGAFSSPAVSKPTASLWGGLQHPQSTVTSALNNRFWCPQYNYNLRQLKLLKELSSPH